MCCMCVQDRHSGAASPVSKCLLCLEALLIFTVRPKATVFADATESAVIMQPWNEVQTSLSSSFPCNQDARGHT